MHDNVKAGMMAMITCADSACATSEIVQLLAERYGDDRFEVRGPLFTRAYSQLFEVRRFTVADGSLAEHIALKRCIVSGTQTPNTLEAIRQFQALERVFEAFLACEKKSSCSVPKPVLLFPDQALIGMSWISGQSLTEQLRNIGFLFRSEVAFARAGEWLFRFHSVGPKCRAYFNIAERDNSIQAMLSNASHDRIFRGGVQTLAKGMDSLSQRTVMRSWLHGDCKTDNFLISDENIYGIDISLAYENAIEYDIGQFLNHLRLALMSPRYIIIRPMIKRLEYAFVDAYIRAGGEVDFHVLKWVRLWSALSLWENMLRSARNAGTRWVFNGMFRSLVARLSQ